MINLGPLHPPSDLSAAFAAAHSLYLIILAQNDPVEGCGNRVQIMENCAKMGQRFTDWAAERVIFEELSISWPYLLEQEFGDAVIKWAGDTTYWGALDADEIPTSSFVRILDKMSQGSVSALNTHFKPDYGDTDPPQKFVEYELRAYRVGEAEDRELCAHELADEVVLYGIADNGLPEMVFEVKDLAAAKSLIVHLGIINASDLNKALAEYE
jgi:hypothetical protein